MPKACGIYRIIHIETDRCYVGQSIDINKRWKQHILDLNAERHHAVHLQRAWTKYGDNAFTFEILEECNLENLTEREQFWMDNLLSEFNSWDAAFSSSGYKISEEYLAVHREKRAERGRELMTALNSQRTLEEKQEAARIANASVTPEMRIKAAKAGGRVRSVQLSVDKEHQSAAGKIRAPITNCKRWNIDRGKPCTCGRHV